MPRRKGEKTLPGVGVNRRPHLDRRRFSRTREAGKAKKSSDVKPYSMSLVSMDATFALLEFNRRPRQVPVDDRMAPGMKIQALLPDSRGCEDERPERRIECSPHGVQPTHGAVCFFDLGKTHGMATT